jgi:hypothetical protein
VDLQLLGTSSQADPMSIITMKHGGKKKRGRSVQIPDFPENGIGYSSGSALIAPLSSSGGVKF